MSKLVPSERIEATHVTVRSAPLGVAIGTLQLISEWERCDDMEKLRNLLYVEIARLNAAMEAGEYLREEDAE